MVNSPELFSSKVEARRVLVGESGGTARPKRTLVSKREGKKNFEGETNCMVGFLALTRSFLTDSRRLFHGAEEKTMQWHSGGALVRWRIGPSGRMGFSSSRLLAWTSWPGAAWPGGAPRGHGFMNRRLVLLTAKLRGGGALFFTRTGQYRQRDDAHRVDEPRSSMEKLVAALRCLDGDWI